MLGKSQNIATTFWWAILQILFATTVNQRVGIFTWTFAILLPIQWQQITLLKSLSSFVGTQMRGDDRQQWIGGWVERHNNFPSKAPGWPAYRFTCITCKTLNLYASLHPPTQQPSAVAAAPSAKPDHQSFSCCICNLQTQELTTAEVAETDVAHDLDV